MLAVVFGIPAIVTLVGPYPLYAIGSALLLFGMTWEIELFRKYGWIGTLMRQSKQIPAYLAWTAISPAFWILYSATNEDVYRSGALGGLFLTIPGALMLALTASSKFRVRLRENGEEALRERQR